MTDAERSALRAELSRLLTDRDDIGAPSTDDDRARYHALTLEIVAATQRLAGVEMRRE